MNPTKHTHRQLTTNKINLFLWLVCGLISNCVSADVFTDLYVAELDTQSPVISPDIKRDARISPKIDTEKLETTSYIGVYKIDGFRAEPVAGIKLAYHYNPLFFVESSLAKAKVKDISVEQLGLPSIFENDIMEYVNVSLGINLLPGQIFVGKNRAVTADFYVTTGFGQLTVDNHGFTSVHFGGGLRALPTDWISLHMDVRSYFINHSFLDPEGTSHNIEYTFGVGLFF